MEEEKKSVHGVERVFSEHVFILSEWGYKRVSIHDIIYLEAQQSYCYIHLSPNNGKKIVSIPMCEVLEDLNPLLFVRIHRSYAINIEHVTLFAGNMIRMDNGVELNIGREYRYNVEEAFVLIGSRKRVKKGSSY